MVTEMDGSWLSDRLDCTTEAAFQSSDHPSIHPSIHPSFHPSIRTHQPAKICTRFETLARGFDHHCHHQRPQNKYQSHTHTHTHSHTRAHVHTGTQITIGFEETTTSPSTAYLLMTRTQFFLKRSMEVESPDYLLFFQKIRVKEKNTFEC